MRLGDYWRLGWANIVAHKKRAAIVVVIVGALFSVLIAGSMLIQGVENATLAMTLQPTDGKVLVKSVAEQTFCEENCDMDADQADIRENIAKWGGTEIAVGTVGPMGSIYAVSPELVAKAIEVNLDAAPDDAIPVLASPSTLAGWLMISSPEKNTPADRKVRVVQTIREQALGKVIETGSQKYFVAGILPGSFGASGLSLEAIGDRSNPLNLLLEELPSASSQTLAIKRESLEAASTAEIWAVFPDLDTAQGYLDNIATENCNSLEVMHGDCPRVKQLAAATVISDPVGTQRTLAEIWKIFRILAVVLAVIACVVALSTYVRLVGRDTRVIALYYALGATKRQVIGVYCTYLLELSLLASLFSVILGAGMVLIVNLLNLTKLKQIFALAFGAEGATVWLLGWNNWIPLLVGLLLLMAPLCMILTLPSFSSKRLAQKMK